jgi:hypothetical protein
VSHMTYLEAAVVGLFQGVSELFPVSSLGHNVLIPALVGGQWAKDLNVATPESPYLAFIVGLHVATAVALIIYFWKDWVRIIGGLISSIRNREIYTVDQKLAWMLVLGTIPVGLAGLLFEHAFRTIFGQAKYAAAFLIVNGVILVGTERYRRRSSLAADAASVLPRPPGPSGCGKRRRCRCLTGGWPHCRSSLPSSSAPPRSSPCSPGSAGTAWPCVRACGAVCPGRMRRGSPSCWPPRSSWPRGC